MIQQFGAPIHHQGVLSHLPDEEVCPPLTKTVPQPPTFKVTLTNKSLYKLEVSDLLGLQFTFWGLTPPHVSELFFSRVKIAC